MEQEKPQVDLKDAFIKAKAEATNNIVTGLKKILMAIGTVALEALVLMYLSNYVFPDLALNYGKTLGLLIMARMILRTTK
jgi:hypothetical protein